MKDWVSIGKASGAEIPTPELECVSQTLAALEATFRPLVRNLEVSLEPAAVFQVEDDNVT